MFNKFIKKYYFVITLVLLFLILRLPSLFEPNWYGDEGIYLVLGQAIRKGLVLYNQIHDNKPPTLYYFAAFSQTVFGFRLFLALWMIPTIYIFHLLSKKLLPLRLSRLATLFFLIITSLPLFEGNIANSEIFMLLPTIWAVYILYQHSLSPTSSLPTKALAISGLLLGFAFTLKVPVAIEFAFLFIWIIIISRRLDFRRLIIFSLFFFIPILIYSIYFYFLGAFGNFVFASILQNFGYLSSWATGSHSGTASSGGLANRGVILFIFWLFIYFLATKKLVSRRLAFISLWFSATLFGALLSTRPYPHYLIQLLPPTVFLLLLFFDKHLKNIVKLYIIFLLSTLTYTYIHFHFYTYPVFSYYQNFYSHLTSLSSPEYRSYFGPGVNNTYAISSFIKSNTAASESIFVWGDSPFIYTLSDRLPVGRFTVAYHIADFNQYQVVIDKLRTDFPNFIIYYHQPSRPYPQLDTFLDRYYFPIKTFGSAIIYRSVDHQYAHL